MKPTNPFFLKRAVEGLKVTHLQSLGKAQNNLRICAPELLYFVLGKLFRFRGLAQLRLAPSPIPGRKAPNNRPVSFAVSAALSVFIAISSVLVSAGNVWAAPSVSAHGLPIPSVCIGGNCPNKNNNDSNCPNGQCKRGSNQGGGSPFNRGGGSCASGQCGMGGGGGMGGGSGMGGGLGGIGGGGGGMGGGMGGIGGGGGMGGGLGGALGGLLGGINPQQIMQMLLLLMVLNQNQTPTPAPNPTQAAALPNSSKQPTPAPTAATTPINKNPFRF